MYRWTALPNKMASECIFLPRAAADKMWSSFKQIFSFLCRNNDAVAAETPEILLHSHLIPCLFVLALMLILRRLFCVCSLRSFCARVQIENVGMWNERDKGWGNHVTSLPRLHCDVNNNGDLRVKLLFRMPNKRCHREWFLYLINTADTKAKCSQSGFLLIPDNPEKVHFSVYSVTYLLISLDCFAEQRTVVMSAI